VEARETWRKLWTHSDKAGLSLGVSKIPGAAGRTTRGGETW